MMWLLASISNVSAEEACSPEAVEQASVQIVQKRGDDAAEAFHQLSLCDTDVALKFVATTVPTFFPNAKGYRAAGDAVLVGGHQDVMKWYEILEPSEQKGLLRELGNRCQKEQVIQDFFVSVANNGTDQFWKSRFHEYITECRVSPLQELLLSQFALGVDQGRSQYFSVMSAMARNLEGNAIPELQKVLDSSEDGEVQLNLVSSIHEAVTASNTNHADDKKLVRDVTVAGIDSVYGNKERLAPEAILRARMMLTAFEAEAEADDLAGYMYKSHQQPDGQYMWGLVVVENTTCKNGKEKQRIYTASVLENGTNWADQLPERIQDVVAVQWDLDLAKRCKGTEDVQYILTELPVSNLDALQVWQTEQQERLLNPNVKKPILLPKEPLKI